MANNNSERKMFKDLTIIWAEVNPARPVAPFGTPVWQATAVTTDSSVADQWKEEGLKVKEKLNKEGHTDYLAQFSRKAIKADGEKSTPVRVVDINKEPFEGRITNNSKCNVICFFYDYDFNGKKGRTYSLDAIQVVEAAKQNFGLDFEDLSTDDNPIF